jgi:sulfate transport system substrate-binding protein
VKGRKSNTIGANALALCLVAGAIGLLLFKHHQSVAAGANLRLLNVSYDPTRELYAQLNPKFIERYKKDTGTDVSISQSHGGSSRQARAVADGSQAADVVTLALPSDIDTLRARRLVADNWKSQFPHDSQPYYSTIVFVVRKGNPKNIGDWADLTAPGVEVVTPNPRTSGNGKLSVLAAFGSVIYRGGTADQARDLLTRLYRNVSSLGQGARDSATTFELAKEGDVQLTWENEAIREVADSKGELQIVYPPVSIRAEPSVAVVSANVIRHNTATAATAYLDFLYSDDAQELLARDGYRPQNAEVLRRHQDLLPRVDLFPVTVIAGDWNDAQEKFFGENGLFNAIRGAMD